MARTTNLQKLTYSGETQSSLGSTLSIARYGVTSMANRGVCAYWGPGQDQDTPYSIGILEKMPFSNDTVSLVSHRSINNGGRYQHEQAVYDKQYALIRSGYDQYSHHIGIFDFTTEVNYVTSVVLNFVSVQEFAANLADSGSF